MPHMQVRAAPWKALVVHLNVVYTTKPFVLGLWQEVFSLSVWLLCKSGVAREGPDSETEPVHFSRRSKFCKYRHSNRCPNSVNPAPAQKAHF